MDVYVYMVDGSRGKGRIFSVRSNWIEEIASTRELGSYISRQAADEYNSLNGAYEYNRAENVAEYYDCGQASGQDAQIPKNGKWMNIRIHTFPQSTSEVVGYVLTGQRRIFFRDADAMQRIAANLIDGKRRTKQRYKQRKTALKPR